MRLALIASLVAAAGCSEDPPGGPPVDSHVEYYDFPATTVPELDVQRCWHEPADADAATAGAQYECDLNAYYDDNTTEPVRQCSPDRTGPCFESTRDAVNCPEAGFARLSLRGFPTPTSPAVRGQCVVTGQN